MKPEDYDFDGAEASTILPFTPAMEKTYIDEVVLASRMSNISLHGINAVLMLNKYESLTFTAVQLGMSQPGLTRLIQRTERAAGCAIFDRSTRPLTLTDKGKRVVESFTMVAGIHTDLLQNTLSLREYADRLKR